MSLPPEYPPAAEGWVSLKNGRAVFVRPILPTDGPLILGLFHQISPASLALRFLKPLDALPDDLLHRLIHLDYTTAFALGAIVPETGEDALIAVPRYGPEPEGATDFAVAVRDDWQRLGLGTLLLTRLFAIGKEHGISRFPSLRDPANTAITRTLAQLRYPVESVRHHDVVHVEIPVGEPRGSIECPRRRSKSLEQELPPWLTRRELPQAI